MINSVIIKELLKNKKISQKKLAEFLEMTPGGVSYLLQNGRTNSKTLEKIAEFFEVPISYFFKNDTDESFFLHNSGNLITGNNVKQEFTPLNNNNILAENIMLRNKLEALEMKFKKLEKENSSLKDKIIKLLDK